MGEIFDNQTPKPVQFLTDFDYFREPDPTALYNPCSPDFTERQHLEPLPSTGDAENDYWRDELRELNTIRPTQNRKIGDDAARESLNSPTISDGNPLSPEEETKAAELQKLITGYTTMVDEDFSLDSPKSKILEQAREFVEKLGDAEAQRIIDAINPALEKQGMRMAKAARSGEIWVGESLEDKSGYYPSIKLKSVDCPVG
ncbi:MAG: hypothetical protein IAF58_11490 [Leptolyngbya sp.]|nr:hypothetical protein [Candidatus Melainabacteria bacterium]